MIIINTPILAATAEQHSTYSTLLLSFYSLIKSIDLGNAFRLTSVFPEAEMNSVSDHWTIPLISGELSIIANIDFKHSIFVIKAVSTPRKKEGRKT